MNKLGIFLGLIFALILVCGIEGCQVKEQTVTFYTATTFQAEGTGLNLSQICKNSIEGGYNYECDGEILNKFGVNLLDNKTYPSTMGDNWTAFCSGFCEYGQTGEENHYSFSLDRLKCTCYIPIA